MQAITTKFIGPTNHRGARVKASCAAKTMTISWDHAMNPELNHRQAALALADSLGWTPDAGYGRIVGGDLPDGTGYAFVFVGDK